MKNNTRKKIIIFSSIGLMVLVIGGVGGSLIYNNLKNVPPKYADFNPADYLDDNTALFADFETFLLESPNLESYQERYNPYQLFNLAIYQGNKSDYIKLDTRGLVDTGGLKQNIFGRQLKNKNTYFNESISKGLVNVARRFYQDEDITWYRGKYNKNKEMVWNPDSETSLSIEQFNEEWGHDFSLFCPYLVSSFTCLETSSITIEDNRLQISLDLDPFFSVLNHVKQMIILGGLETAPIFKNINLKITLDENFVIQTTEVLEKYKVQKFGWFDATGTLTGNFTFGEKEEFPPLQTEIIYT